MSMWVDVSKCSRFSGGRKRIKCNMRNGTGSYEAQQEVPPNGSGVVAVLTRKNFTYTHSDVAHSR
jgi:hypothetical protein